MATRTRRPKPEEVAKATLPVYEGAQVEEVLQDGRETETAYHCKMSDGTTKHVPKALFGEAPAAAAE